MTPQQVALIKGSFASIAHLETEVAEIFYGKLFELDPSLRRLFPNDMTEQGQKLMKVLGVVVANAGRLDTVIPTVRGLGKRHLAYGVKEAHYDTVGRALLETLATGLGDGFTPEVREAWTQVYTTLSTIMIDAARVHVHSQHMEAQMHRDLAARAPALSSELLDSRPNGNGRALTYGIFAAIIAVTLLVLLILRQLN